MNLELRVLTPATLPGGAMVMGIRYADGFMRSGPMDGLHSAAIEGIEDLVRSFAAAYYKAGNG